MITIDPTSKRVLLHLLKDFSRAHTITLLAEELGVSRVGIWKVLKKLEDTKFIVLNPVGRGKTSTSLVSLNWENPLVEKTLSLYLTEKALKQRRWRVNFAGLEKLVSFAILYGSILHSPQEAGDIDIVLIAPKKNLVKTQMVIEKVQKTQSKKVHAISFTASEFKTELQKPNKVFIDAVKKGVILYGQENCIIFMKKMAA